MKSLIFILLAPYLLFSQSSTHTFFFTDQGMEYDTGWEYVFYDTEPNLYSYDDRNMNADSLEIAKKKYAYRGNRMELDTLSFKFRKPWLSKKSHLVDVNSKKTLITYRTDLENGEVTETINQETLNSYTLEVQEVILNWALFKQVEYVYFYTDDVYILANIVDAITSIFVLTTL
jgi:hypothetical protein